MLIVRAFPVSGRQAVALFARELNARSYDARRFFTSFGISREAWFFQRWEHGDIVIVVTDAGEPVRQHARAYGETREEFASWFKDHVKELTGIDPSVMPLGPPTDQVFDSGSGPLERNVPLVVRAYPLRSREHLEDFVEDVHRRPDETRAMYRSLRTREIWFVQETEQGPIAIAVAAMTDPEKTARDFAAARDRFAIWFKQRVEDVSGVNPHRTPLGPGTEKVFDYGV
jgi:hypothetical protein